MPTPASTTAEHLEPRRLLASAVVIGGILRVTGDPGARNTIVIAQTADESEITVTVNSTNRRGNANTPLSRSFPKTPDITEIWVRTGGGDDNIRVGQPDLPVGIDDLDIPTRVWSGAGGDVIETPDAADFILPGKGNNIIDGNGGDDVIWSGPGNDYIEGSEENDTIRGGGGNDTVLGGIGDDQIAGGKGDDQITGNGGNDTLLGQAGADSLNGEGGADVLFGGFGNDALRGEANDDTLWGGPGDDDLDGGIGNDILGGVLGTNNLVGGAGGDTFHVRDITLHTSDYSEGSGDVLEIVTIRREGPKEPVI